MSEIEWIEVPDNIGRITNKKLGGDFETAVIRWKNRYRIIRVNDVAPLCENVFIFGCVSSLDRIQSLDTVDAICVKICGVQLMVSNWVVRSEKTIPPNGHKANISAYAVRPQDAWNWSLVKPIGVRCIVLRARGKYRGVFWESPQVGDVVLVQGVFMQKWLLLSRDGEMCLVSPLCSFGHACSGRFLIVHRTCLIAISSSVFKKNEASS